MRSKDKFPVKALWMCLVILGLLPMTACHTAGSISPVDFSQAGWQVQQGQAVWHWGGKRPDLAGDLTLAIHSGGRCFIQFAKTPFPVVTAECDNARWNIEFPPLKLHFSGKNRPPARLTWLQLCRALSGKELAPNWRFQKQGDGFWLLEDVRSGESVKGYLAP